MIALIPLLIGLPLILFWLWMLVDLANNDYLSKGEKNDWFSRFLLMNFIAAAWYYLIEYRARRL